MSGHHAGPSAIDVPLPATAAPVPFIVANEYKTLLCYRVLGAPPELRALVSFHGVHATRWGPVIDEHLSAHEFGRVGPGFYSPYQYSNSEWLDQAIGAAVVASSPWFLGTLYHFVFPFHESTFECLAASIRVEVSSAPPARIREELVAFAGCR